MSTVRIGRTASGQDVLARLDQHTLVTGASGFGKSYLLQSVIYQMPRSGWQLAGFDPTGILFNAVGESLGGSSLRATTLSNPDRVREVFEVLVAELDSRITDLLAMRTDKLVDFGDARPRILVLVEEFVSGFGALNAIDFARGLKPADRVEPRIRASLMRIALEGRKVGMHIWIASQRADTTYLTGIIRSQLVQKFTLNQDADGLRMVHEGITPEQVERAQAFLPGHGFAQQPGVPSLVEFQADVIDYESFCGGFEGREHPPPAVSAAPRNSRQDEMPVSVPKGS